MLITAPTPSPTEPTNDNFEHMLQMVIQRGPGFRASRTFALDHGVDETALVDYATGAVSTYERSEVEWVLARCDWARKYVVDYVKQRRKQERRAA